MEKNGILYCKISGLCYIISILIDNTNCVNGMIQVIERTFAILEELSLDGEVSLESLARITGLNKGTLCNILRTMIELGYVSRPRSSHYSLTGRFRELAQEEMFSPVEIEAFRKCVNSLAESTGESGVLAVMRGDRIAVTAQAQYQRALMINPFEIYAALSLYRSVSGRILVSNLSVQERKALCARTGYPGADWEDISSSAELEISCKKIRQSGISIMENPVEQIISFAVPVFHSSGKVMSLGLTMPMMRCRAGERNRIIKLLKEHAAAISQK